MKKILTFIIIFLLVFTLKANAYEVLTPNVSSDNKVYDYANLFSEEEKELLKEEIDKFIKETDYDFVVVTISKNPYGTGYNAPTDYAKDFYDYNKYGKRVNRAGAIVLIDMQNREVIFDRSGHALLTYDDVRGKSVSDTIARHLKNKEYGKGVLEGLKLSKEYYERGIPESNKDYCVNDEGHYYRCVKRVNYLWSFIIAGIVTLISTLVHLSRYKGIRLATNANNYMTGEVKGESKDEFLFTNTTRTRVNDSSSSGGSGGGTTISRGSSGRSHSSSRSSF